MARAGDPARLEPAQGQARPAGGHVEPDETAQEAAVRELAEETGVAVPAGAFVRQVGVFDAPGRDARGRYVSVAYAVVLPEEAPDPVAADDAAAAEWMPVRVAVKVARAGGFAFDHDRMLSAAIVACNLPRTLRTELDLREEP
ncbi:NUDIX domain-containing protein [Amycolatopsis tolypomycina]|uniref:NUDIX domain-containing protein n=1 Tax=Amycolatopsis tolypomycina TaxID=208445 RepID=UPI00313440B8